MQRGGAGTSLVGWPAVCQLHASKTLSGVEKGLLSPTCTRSLFLSHPPNPGPEKSGRQILLLLSILLIHACGDTHTHTLILSAVQGVCSLLCLLHTHTQMHGGPKSFHAILYMSLLLTPRTKQVIRAWVESSIHTVLSVCSQSASLSHGGRTPLTAGRI